MERCILPNFIIKVNNIYLFITKTSKFNFSKMLQNTKKHIEKDKIMNLIFSLAKHLNYSLCYLNIEIIKVIIEETFCQIINNFR